MNDNNKNNKNQFGVFRKNDYRKELNEFLRIN